MRRPYTDLSNLPGLGSRVGARCVSLQGVVSISVTGRQIVPLEVFTTWATQASPLHRSIEFTGPGMPRRHPLRFSAGRRQHQRDGSKIVPLEVFTNRETHASPLHRFIEFTGSGMSRRCPLRFSAGRHRYQRDGSKNRSVGGLYRPGDACVAPTQIYRIYRAWDAASAPVAFLCRASSASA